MKSWETIARRLVQDSIFEGAKKQLYTYNFQEGVLIGVSGGPDSMCAAHLLLGVFLEKGRPIEKVTICYYNHKQRNAADKEAQFINNYFSGVTTTIDTYQGSDDREHRLREARWAFFEDQLRKNKYRYFITGHNLTDRLETTIMNLERGSGLLGFLNMSEVDKSYIYPADGGVYSYETIRPILSLSKEKITHLCDQYSIPYTEDPTNLDPSVSYRNEVRQRIKNKFTTNEERNRFYQHVQQLYTRLEERSLQSQEKLLTPSRFRGNQLPYFSSPLPKNRHELTCLLSTLKIYKGPTKGTIYELFEYFTTSGGGWKQYAGWFLFRGYENCYFIKADRPFWKDYVSHSEIIKSGGSHTIGDFQWDIDKKYIGATLRFPQQGDKYKGKSLFSRMNNQQIPVFRRKYIPLIEDGGDITAVFPSEIGKGKHW